MKENALKLLNYTIEMLSSFWFSWEHRISPNYFSRNTSMLSFYNTALMILNLIKKAIAVEVMAYFNLFEKLPKIPSRQAFSKAREKISYKAFKDFFDKSCELAITANDAKVYKGYRLLAVDGTSFFVGDIENESLNMYFGESTTIKGKAMCRLSGVVDVLNNCIVNALVAPFKTGEQTLAIEQVKILRAVNNALFLYDRGYWSPKLVGEMINSGQKFLMRIPSDILNTSISSANGEVVKLRRYSFTLPSGTIETLVTNLSEEEMTDDELTKLYARRWGIESKYLELKSRLEIESFSGQSANIVLQDIYSTLYISNLTAFLCFQADEIIEEKNTDKNNKYDQKTNRSNCISVLRDRFIKICLISSPLLRAIALNRLVKDISQNVSYIGKSKSRPRDKLKIKASRSRNSRKIIL